MKTKKSLATVLAVMLVVVVSAIEKPKMSFESLSADKAIFTVLNKNAAIFEVSILTENDEIVYFKQSDKPLSNYQKIFDFENLENGDYTLKLKVNNAISEKNFTVTSRKIYMGELEQAFEPLFNFNGQKLRFTLINNNEDDFKFKVYKENELVYKTKIGNDFVISSGYDLSKLEAGNYKVVLGSNKNEFDYRLEK